jgi:GT2 family glycosyltransferase
MGMSAAKQPAGRKRVTTTLRPEQRQLGFVDRVSETQIIGWALDLDRPKTPVRLAVSVDGQVVDTLACDQKREDLAGSGLPNDHAGFIYDIPRRFYDGAQHTIALRFYTGTPVLFTNRLGQSVAEWHFAHTRRAIYQGFVDGLTEGGALNGWLFRSDTETGARIGGNRLLVLIDGNLASEIVADQFRPDVGGAHRCDPHCGFSYIPPAKYRSGKAFRFRFLVANDRTELLNSPLDATFLPNDAAGTLHELLDLADDLATQTWQMKQRLKALLQVDEMSLTQYAQWAKFYFERLSARVAAARTEAAGPLVSIVCPTWRPNLPHFIAAVQSVQAQSYTNWELIVVDDASGDATLKAWITDVAKADRRIRLVTRRRNGGIGAATNTAIDQARGEYVAFFDHDDLLVDVAIEAMMQAAQTSGARLLYSDEDKIDERGNLSEPHLKSDWNYRLLLGSNFVCHLLVMRRDLLRQIGPLSTAHDGAQDHELLLRAAEMLTGDEICHVPEILYHWRKTPGSTAQSTDAKGHAAAAGVAAVEAHLRRRGLAAEVSALTGMTAYRVRWQRSEEPLVAIIIPYRDQVDVTLRCLRAILSLTAYRNYEIVLVDNWSQSTGARDFAADVSNIAQVRVLRVPEPFNFSRLNNLAVREVPADYYMFMNNDLFVTESDWLRVLVDEALSGEHVGAVGGKFVYADATVQHGGVIVGVGGVAEHAHRGLAQDAPGYMARALLAQELSAVTAAGMLCDARAFAEVGGFDETDLLVAFNDVDLCLKLRAAGWRVIWTPEFIAEHHESISRGDDNDPAHRRRFYHENQTMHERWADVIARDPHYNQNFSRRSGIFRILAAEPEGRP